MYYNLQLREKKRKKEKTKTKKKNFKKSVINKPNALSKASS